MATIRKRNNKWHVQIRRKEFQSKTKTFLLKKDAQLWARQTEILSKNYNLILLDVSEISKADAGLSCMSIRW